MCSDSAILLSCPVTKENKDFTLSRLSDVLLREGVVFKPAVGITSKSLGEEILLQTRAVNECRLLQK